jgi:hypothetical protein
MLIALSVQAIGRKLLSSEDIALPEVQHLRTRQHGYRILISESPFDPSQVMTITNIPLASAERLEQELTITICAVMRSVCPTSFAPLVDVFVEGPRAAARIGFASQKDRDAVFQHLPAVLRQQSSPMRLFRSEAKHVSQVVAMDVGTSCLLFDRLTAVVRFCHRVPACGLHRY